MKLVLALLLIVFLTGSTRAGSYQIVHQEVIEGGEEFTSLDPIVDISNETIGLIYCDYRNFAVVFDYHNNVLDFEKLLDFHPSRSVNCIAGSARRAYVLVQESDVYARFICLEMGGDYSVVADLPAERFQPPADALWRPGRPKDMGLTMLSTDGEPYGLSFHQTTPFHTSIGGGPYIEHIDMSNAAVYDLELETLVPQFEATRVLLGDVCAGGSREIVSFMNWYLSWQEWGINWVDSGTESDFWIEVKRGAGDTVMRMRDPDGQGLQLLVDNFDREPLLDEVIYYGQSDDLLGLHESGASHAALYSFASGTPEELWYMPLSGVTLEHVYRPQHFIAGMRGPGEVITLNYWTGVLSDSVALDRELEATTFFETGSDPPVLNLVGRNHDTIFVYQFQTPTEVANETEVTLPTSFSLVQNYPNPFNCGTVISFSNQIRQRLQLKIYNVLGQEVVVLHDQDTPARDFSISWNGRDKEDREVASGVYFARLASPTESKLIKMVMLK